MGLFGLKKDETGPALSEFYSKEDLQYIKDVLHRNMMGTRYRVVYYQTTAREMIGFAGKPDSKLNEKKLGRFVKAAETVEEFEPSLAPVLEKGVPGIRYYLKEGKIPTVEESFAESAGESAAEAGINTDSGRDQLMKAIEESGKSYEEIMELIGKKNS